MRRCRCDECRANVVHEDCVTAKYIDLLDRAMRFMDERQLPEGVEWPRFEDGELVKIGDAYEKASGTTGVVTSIHLRQYGGVPTWVIGKGGGKVCVRPGRTRQAPRTRRHAGENRRGRWEELLRVLRSRLRNLQGGRRVRSARFVRAV